MNLFENIRRIGIFMIAAQTAMHFAAGKQYEKYMKVITGVIILLMFIGPFISTPENLVINWQAEIGRLEKQIQESMQQQMSYAINSVEAETLQQIEQEVKERLNDAISVDDARVTDVSIDLDKKGGAFGAGTGSGEQSWVFQRVKVTLQGNDGKKFADIYDGGIIGIDEITVGAEPEENVDQEEYDSDQNAKVKEYQRVFAQTLGVAEDRVEVKYRGEP